MTALVGATCLRPIARCALERSTPLARPHHVEAEGHLRRRRRHRRRHRRRPLVGNPAMVAAARTAILQATGARSPGVIAKEAVAGATAAPVLLRSRPCGR